MKRVPAWVKWAVGIFVVLAITVIGLLMILGPIIGNTFSTINTSLNTVPGSGGAAPSGPVVSVEDSFAQIDKQLRQAVTSSIAYNAPPTMMVDESTIIELAMNPSLSGGALAEDVSGPGPVLTASVEITPLMKASLYAHDPDAFVIQPLFEDATQPISGSSTTRWQWSVTPQKEGRQRLTLAIYRLVKYAGQDYWREVKSYETNIDVRVSLAGRLASLDWKWLGGGILTLIGIPAFWRWFDARRQKQAAPRARLGGGSHDRGKAE